MKPENFVYWLQGYLEIAPDNTGLTPEQVNLIKEHINLALTKVTGEKYTFTDKIIELGNIDPNTGLRIPREVTRPTLICSG